MFANNNLTDESIDAIVKLLGGNNKIRSLDLTNNKIGCDGIRQLAEVLSEQPKGKLETLILSLNDMREDGCGSLCQVIAQTKFLLDLICSLIGRILSLLLESKFSTTYNSYSNIAENV